MEISFATAVASSQLEELFLGLTIPMVGEESISRADFSENTVVTCGRPPNLAHGTYVPIGSGEPWTAWTTSSTSSSSQFYPGTTLQPTCDPEFSLNCSYHCGRIKCDSDGSWIPVDGELISSCSALGGHVLGSVSNDSTSNGNNGHGKHESPEMNYFVLGLAVVCIVAVGALIIMALRRPIFCKKGGHSEENPVIMTSSSPNPPPLDSLPIAMNTGIFLPGARYDLQDCNFQDIPIVGTTVFK
ncbi:unnamed protein product [Allacma fusca]|uniref:Sushi domain-containing protein n=1 Tax=Allacma fusca TaxID=39272 RepID=A0A8J2J2I1_9HEXA|nr:unnamed protein product [Allacma fusca]